MATQTLVDPGWGWDDQFLYSQAIRAGDLVFVSGQAALKPDGSVAGPGDFPVQAEQVFANLRAVLQKAGGDLKDIVKVSIFLTDMANFPKIVELRNKYFSAPYPADTTVEVTSLALPNLMVEIDAVALIPE